MVCVGIDVAKDKHDCCILDSDGTIRADCITIPNNMDILPRNVLKESTTMLPYPMPRRNLCG